ncbi:unnamed protein product, partial [marine sediment metagenome]
ECKSAMRKLENTIERIQHALLLRGICPDCGRELPRTEQEKFIKWKCKCGLETWISKRYIREKIRKGEPEKTISLYVHRCHKCGRPITPEPTALETLGNVMILCETCASQLPSKD